MPELSRTITVMMSVVVFAVNIASMMTGGKMTMASGMAKMLRVSGGITGRTGMAGHRAVSLHLVSGRIFRRGGRKQRRGGDETGGN